MTRYTVQQSRMDHTRYHVWSSDSRQIVALIINGRTHLLSGANAQDKALKKIVSEHIKALKT